MSSPSCLPRLVRAISSASDAAAEAAAAKEQLSHRPYARATEDVFDDEIEIAAHRPLAERRKEDAVRLAPVGLVAERGEQPVAGETTHHAQARPGHFAKSAFVTQRRDHIGIGHEDAYAAAELQLENALGKVASD